MSKIRLSGGEDHIPAIDVARRVDELADRYSKLYEYEDEIAILNVLQGANSFATDLARKIDHPRIYCLTTQIGSMVGSFAHRPKFKGEAVPMNIKDRMPLLVVESMDRTRATLTEALPRFRGSGPTRLDLAVLLLNTESPKVTDDLDADSVEYGFEIPDRYVAGYGLDYSELYRDFGHISACVNIGGVTLETENYVPIVDKREARRLALLAS